VNVKVVAPLVRVDGNILSVKPEAAFRDTVPVPPAGRTEKRVRRDIGPKIVEAQNDIVDGTVGRRNPKFRQTCPEADHSGTYATTDDFKALDDCAIQLTETRSCHYVSPLFCPFGGIPVTAFDDPHR
jgi:hypothetical protein